MDRGENPKPQKKINSGKSLWSLGRFFTRGSQEQNETQVVVEECEMVEVEDSNKYNAEEFDDGSEKFEEVTYPPRPPKLLDLALIERTASRSLPLSQEDFDSYFDGDGRLIDEHRLRQNIFKGGIEPSARKEVWKFLFGFYPFGSTHREREILSEDQKAKYLALKARWKTMLSTDEDGIKLMRINYATIHFDACEESEEAIVPLTDPECTKYMEDLSAGSGFSDIQAKIYAERQPTDLNTLKRSVLIIDKDVPRTDRELDFFRGADNKKLLMMRDILITFAAFHSEVNYAQGMNDLLSRFLVVLDNEVEAYWCFCRYLEQIENDFLESGLMEKLNIVKDLLTEVDPDLWKYLDLLGIGDMTFCHRWMLLSFKREFSWEESLHLFEILCSHHLELSSMEAEKIRERERRKDFQHSGGKSRISEVQVNTSFTFDIFVCVTILVTNRDTLFNCLECSEVIQFICGLTKTMDVEQILQQAETMFYKYCSKSVSDCFQVMDDVPQECAVPQQAFAL